MMDVFLQIEGIAGGSTDRLHRGWIDVFTFHHAFDRFHERAWHEMHVCISVDRSLRDLMAAISSNRIFASVTIEGVGPTGEHHLMIRYRLHEVFIMSLKCGQFESSVTGALRHPVAQVVFTFRHFELTVPQLDYKTGKLIETHSFRSDQSASGS